MFCKTCKTRDTCTKICDKVNKYMSGKGIYAADYIRPKMPSDKRGNRNIWREIPFSALKNHNLGIDSEGI